MNSHYPMGLLKTLPFAIFMIMPLHAENLAETLQQRGFKELPNRILLKSDFNELYRSFDDFIHLMDHNKEFATLVYQLEARFLGEDDQKKRYCSAPPSYRDPRQHATKRFNKIYFQFIREHYDLVKHEFAQYPLAQEFIERMKLVDNTSKVMFKELLKELETKLPGISDRIKGTRSDLTIISKIVRYRKGDTPEWGTTPHVDKSALSLIWDSNDQNDESLLICENTQSPTLDGVKKPQRKYSGRRDMTSAIILPGAALKKAHIDLNPTVHAVGPIPHTFRHAVISFLLIPDIDMSDIKTDFTG